MSRIGKQPILIPETVKVQIDGQKVIITGPKGELLRIVRPEIKVEIKDGNILVMPKGGSLVQDKPSTRTSSVLDKNTKAFWGLERALLQNMIIGVTQGFEKKLELIGIGYKAKLEQENLVLEAGFTHPVKIQKPENINFEVKENIITVSGIDKLKVGQTAAKIRKVRPPERYKGKGIRYLGEEVKLKPGKKAATAT